MVYDKNNIFAKIIRGDIETDKVYEDDHAIAINDLSPAAPVHVLVLPKGEYCSFDDFVATAPKETVAAFFSSVQHVASNVLNLTDSGYRLIMNHGQHASQTVPHFHVHILGGEPLGGLLASDRKVR